MSFAVGAPDDLERLMSRFDAIVIGSGFGGAVTACRLAEKGMKVLKTRISDFAVVPYG